MNRSALLLLALGGASCLESSPTPDAASPDAARVDATPSVDSSVPPDSLLDAAPDYSDLFCTGRPIPPGLTCIIQDPSQVGPCDGGGAVVFDGTQCRVARGAECGASGRGAFESLEECGVTCAAAGHCTPGRIWCLPGEGARVPEYCGHAPAECVIMSVDGYPLSPGCAVWGVLGSPDRRATTAELPYPEQWDVLWSLTLVSDIVGPVTCGQEP